LMSNASLSTYQPGMLKQTVNRSQAILSMMRRPNMVNIDDLSNEELIELAINVFQKLPVNRTANDLKTLMKCMSAVEFFKQYDEKTVEKCVKYMYCKNLKKDEKVFEMNTVGTTFWVVLKGSVSVWIMKKIIEKEDDQEKEKEIMINVRDLPAGSAFGELALLSNKPRAATIQCNEDSQLAVLDKLHFDEILKEKAAKKLQIEIEFLSALPIFKTWTYNSLKLLFINMPLQKYKRGQVMYNEGDSSDKMYIIKNGQFKVLKQIEMDERIDNDLSEMKARMNRLKPVTRTIDLSILGDGELFGEEEFIGRIKRKYKVVCSSLEGDVYEISKKEFSNPKLPFFMSLKWLNQNISMKKEHYQERIDGVQRSHKINNNYLVFKREDPTSIKSKVLSKFELEDCREHFNSSMALHLDCNKNPESPSNANRIPTTQGNVSSRINTNANNNINSSPRNQNQPVTKNMSASMDYAGGGLLNPNILPTPSRGGSSSPIANLKGYRGIKQEKERSRDRDLPLQTKSPKRATKDEEDSLQNDLLPYNRVRTADPKPVYTKLMTVNIESRKKKKERRVNTTISPPPATVINTNASAKNNSMLDLSTVDDKITGPRKLRQMSSNMNNERLNQSLQHTSKDQLDDSTVNIRISSIPPQNTNVHTVIRRLSEVTGIQNDSQQAAETTPINNPYKRMFLHKMLKKLQQFSSGSGVSITEQIVAATPLLKKRQHLIPNSFIPMNNSISNQRAASQERRDSASPKGASAVLEDKSGTYYEGKAFRPFEMRKQYVNGTNKFLAGYLAELTGRKKKKNGPGGVVIIVDDSQGRRPGRFERYDSRLHREKDRSADFDYSLLGAGKREMKKAISNSFKVGSVQYLESLANNEVVVQHGRE